MNWTKRILTYFIVIFIILSTCLIFLLNTFDPNQFKSSISQAISKALGHTTTIKGKISWQYFPRLGMNIKQVSIYDHKTPLAEIGQLEASVSLINLIRSKVIIKKVILQDATLSLSIDKDGKNNWFSPTNNPDTNKTSLKPDNKKTLHHGTKSKLAMLELKKIQIQNANIKVTSPTYKINILNFNFNAKSVSLKHPMSYDLNTHFSGSLNNHSYSGNLNMSGTLYIYPSEGDIGSNGIETTAMIALTSIKYNKVKINKIKSKLHLDKSHYRFDLEQLDAYNGNTTGYIDFNRTNENLVLQTKVDKIAIGSLLTDLDDIKLVDGVFTSTLNLTSRGRKKDLLLSNLNGKANIDIKQGRLVEIDINGIVHWVDSLLLNKKSLESMLKSVASLSTYTGIFTQKSTPFDFLSGETIITNGVANFNKIDLASKTLRVHGDGHISIKDQTIDLRLKAVTPEKYDPDSALLKTFGKAGIPFRVHGSLTDPKVNPDTNSIAQSLSKRLWHNVTKDFDGSFKSINKNFKKLKKLKNIIH